MPKQDVTKNYLTQAQVLPYESEVFTEIET